MQRMTAIGLGVGGALLAGAVVGYIVYRHKHPKRTVANVLKDMPRHIQDDVNAAMSGIDLALEDIRPEGPATDHRGYRDEMIAKLDELAAEHIAEDNNHGTGSELSHDSRVAIARSMLKQANGINDSYDPITIDFRGKEQYIMARTAMDKHDLDEIHSTLAAYHEYMAGTSVEDDDILEDEEPDELDDYNPEDDFRYYDGNEDSGLVSPDFYEETETDGRPHTSVTYYPVDDVLYDGENLVDADELDLPVSFIELFGEEGAQPNFLYWYNAYTNTFHEVHMLKNRSYAKDILGIKDEQKAKYVVQKMREYDE